MPYSSLFQQACLFLYLGLAAAIHPFGILQCSSGFPLKSFYSIINPVFIKVFITNAQFCSLAVHSYSAKKKGKIKNPKIKINFIVLLYRLPQIHSLCMLCLLLSDNI